MTATNTQMKETQMKEEASKQFDDWLTVNEYYMIDDKNEDMKDTQMTQMTQVNDLPQSDCPWSQYSQDPNDICEGSQVELDTPPEINVPLVNYESDDLNDDLDDEREIVGYMEMKDGTRITIYKDEFIPMIHDYPDKDDKEVMKSPAETPRSESGRENLSKTVSWNDDVMEENLNNGILREDPINGYYYTYQEFKDYYGDDSMWDLAHPARSLIDEKVYEVFEYANKEKMSEKATKLLLDTILENSRKMFV